MIKDDFHPIRDASEAQFYEWLYQFRVLGDRPSTIYSEIAK